MPLTTKILSKDIATIVESTIEALREQYGLDYMAPMDIKDVTTTVMERVNTNLKPPVRVNVLARGTENVIIVFQKTTTGYHAGDRLEIPLTWCYPEVKDGDACWAQYRSNPSWGRWYLIDKVDIVP